MTGQEVIVGKLLTFMIKLCCLPPFLDAGLAMGSLPK
jgi:hypothetical protein